MLPAAGAVLDSFASINSFLLPVLGGYALIKYIFFSPFVEELNGGPRIPHRLEGLSFEDKRNLAPTGLKQAQIGQGQIGFA